MRLILLISTSLGLILLNGCAKTNHEENLDQAIGTFSRSIEVDGETREYLIYIPNSYDTIKFVPLLLNFHGFGGSANEFMNDADMRSLAASYSFILVYPQGSSLDGFSHWNACPIGGDNKSDADDFGFVEAIINKVSSQYNIDVERIYSAGYSNGGMMAYGLANYRSDLIAAVASVSGAMLDCIGSTSHPMPVVHLHGTSDDVLPYNGSNDWNSVQSTLDHWINFNNTTTNPTVSTVNSEGTTIEHYLYGQGNRSVSVEHYKYIEGGHVWFSAAFQGRNTSELVWDFVSQFDINGKR
ncbi:dienelactone hydrolase family protein [Flavobacteriaceae bacterium]|nr:dienelactone hydrolase family protein [Flavobacteriaceae bacterium]